jgi:hypothetical protein
MRTILSLIFAGLFLPLSCTPAQTVTNDSPIFRGKIDETSRFIFYSVLEGLYEDGVSNQDVDQILMKKDKQCYYHFIYACPICTATIWALQAYRSRPEAFYSIKGGEGATFGPGLSDALHQQLYSADPHQRLMAINNLMRDWMTRRMTRMNLSQHDRGALAKGLEKAREQGMEDLKSFRTSSEQASPNGLEYYAPAYTDLTECAVCNGAVGKPMKLPLDEKNK